MGKQWKQWGLLFSWAPKSLQRVTAAMKLKDDPWKKSYDQLRQHIKMQIHHFADKGLSSQSFGFSNSHVWIWELDHKKSWAPKNWCFWTVVLERTLESPLDCKGIQLVHPKGNQSWVFTGRADAEAETLVLWPPMWRTHSLQKTLMLGKIEGRRRRGRQRMRCLDGITDWMDVSLSKLREWVKPGMLPSMGSQSRTGLNWTDWYLLCTLFLLHQLYLRSSGIGSRRLGTPPLEDEWITCETQRTFPSTLRESRSNAQQPL